MPHSVKGFTNVAKHCTNVFAFVKRLTESINPDCKTDSKSWSRRIEQMLVYDFFKDFPYRTKE